MEHPYPILLALASGSLAGFMGAYLGAMRVLRRWERGGLMRLLEVIAK